MRLAFRQTHLYRLVNMENPNTIDVTWFLEISRIYYFFLQMDALSVYQTEQYFSF